jgi:hypothetical protein
LRLRRLHHRRPQGAGVGLRQRLLRLSRLPPQRRVKPRRVRGNLRLRPHQQRLRPLRPNLRRNLRRRRNRKPRLSLQKRRRRPLRARPSPLRSLLQRKLPLQRRPRARSGKFLFSPGTTENGSSETDAICSSHNQAGGFGFTRSVLAK